MGDAKRIRVAPITRAAADECVKRWHYSGKGAINPQLNLGAFLDGQLLGAMQFGPSLDKRKLQGLVADTPWNGFLELNRMAFADALPRNSESRCLAVAMRLMRQHAPHVQWVVSFADGAQCGDGTIYRASGFVLTGIRRNTAVWEAPTGERFSRVGLTDVSTKCARAAAAKLLPPGAAARAGIGGGASMKVYADAGFKPVEGFQLRYLYPIAPDVLARLTVPVLPFETIDAMGARMYLGVRPGPGTPHGTPEGVGGSTPTPGLQSAKP